MSYLVQPDPDPGRCKNFRHDTGPYGRSRRCLEAEGSEHVCRFQPLTQAEEDAAWGRGSGHSYVHSPSRPKPWKVPPK